MSIEKTSLKKAIQQHCESFTLNTGQLSQLLELQNQCVPESVNDAVPSHFFERSFFYGMAVMLIFGVALLFIVQQLPSDYSQQIAQEVVYNHLKRRPLDIESNSSREIAGFFTELEFSPISSALLQKQFSLRDADVLGGRYCSIRGVMAAQLRYGQAEINGHAANTLYQVVYDKEVHGVIPHLNKDQSPKHLQFKGVDVSMWVEQGLLLVLVSSQRG